MVLSLLLVLLLAASRSQVGCAAVVAAEENVVEYMLGPIPDRHELPDSFIQKHIDEEGFVIHRHLTAVHPKCEEPFTWTEPAWWQTYAELLGANLKKCPFHHGKPPPVGSQCLERQADFICLYGNEECGDAVGPEDQCECKDGLWTCEKVCNKCPAKFPSGTCDPLVHDKTCKYNEYCCCGNCFDTGGCTCETWGNTSEWVCYQADVLPCNNCLEDVGCPCDRPKVGDACDGDYGCGDGCCGADAYFCTCTDGTYDKCVTSAGIGAFLDCQCVL
jgi:hypothetical protein